MAEFSTKQFQELNEAYVSMYRTEEVVEEVIADSEIESLIEEWISEENINIEESTDEELEEGLLDFVNNYKRKPAQSPTQEFGGYLSGVKKLAGKVRDAYKNYNPPGSRPTVRIKPGEKAGPPAPSANTGTIGGLIKKTPDAPKVDAPKADTPKPTPAPAASPAPAAPAAEVKTREIKKPSGGAERRTPTMGELRAAQAARAAGKSEKDVVKAGVAAGKPKVATRPVTPPPQVKKKSRLDTALSGIGKWSEEKEAYDVVLEYLLSGGHAETVEEAHYVMLEMDTETIKTICEEAQEG